MAHQHQPLPFRFTGGRLVAAKPAPVRQQPPSPVASKRPFAGLPLRTAGVREVGEDGKIQENFLERIMREYDESPTKRAKRTDEDEDVDDKKPALSPNVDGRKRRLDDDPRVLQRIEAIAPGMFKTSLDNVKRRKFEEEEERAVSPPPPPQPVRPREIVRFSRKRQPNMLSGMSYLLQVLQGDAEEEADKLRNTRVHLRWEYEILNVKLRGDCIGDIRIKRKDEALEHIYENVMQPSKHQRLMHLALKAISYPSFYGSELNAHMVRILRANNWSEFRTEAIVEAPRRFGKTVGVSMDAAAELVTQPGNATNEYGHDVLCYSNNHRASKMLLLQTYKFVKSLCGEGKFGGHIIGINKNESIRFMTRERYINEMYAYPAKAETLRGTGSKCPTGTVIAEEFAYIPEEVFFGILAPTLTRRNVKFIGITTVNGSDSFVSPLTTAKYPDGRSVFLTLNFQLICTECKAAKREAQCRCLIGEIPRWQSATQHDKLTIIMEKRIGKFLQEIKGLAIDETTTPAFCQIACQFLRTAEAEMKVREIYSDTVFVAVDPACGGRYSKFAIVSAIFVPDPRSKKVLMIVSVLFLSVVAVRRLWFRLRCRLCLRRNRARASRKKQISGGVRHTAPNRVACSCTAA